MARRVRRVDPMKPRIGTVAWNPRFVAYALAHGRGPQEQLDHDKRRYPGGRMAGYIVWHGKMLMEWVKQAGADPDHPLGGDGVNESFDRFLDEQSETACPG